MTPKINPSFKKQQEIIDEIKKFNKANKLFTFNDFKNIIYDGGQNIPKLNRSIERNINRYINDIRENFKFEIKIRKLNKTKIFVYKDNSNTGYSAKPEEIQKIIINNRAKKNPEPVHLNDYDSKNGKYDYLIYPLEIVNNINEPFIRGIQVLSLYNSKKQEYIKAASTKIKRFYFSRIKNLHKHHSVRCNCPIITKLIKEYDSYEKDDLGFIYQKKSELNFIKLNCTDYFEMILKSKYRKLYNSIQTADRIRSVNCIGKNGQQFNKEIEIKFIHVDLLSQIILGYLNHIQIKNSQSAKTQIMDYLSKNL
jgi:hypothetical protein